MATRPPYDREARKGMGDFLSDLLQRSDADAARAEDIVAKLLEELGGHAKVRRAAREVDLRDLSAEAGDLWTEAERLAVDALDELEPERQ